MKKVRITAVRKASYPDLMEQYENPIQHACDVEEGRVWIANGWAKPEGFCGSAWDSISAFVMTLAHGGGNFYDGAGRRHSGCGREEEREEHDAQCRVSYSSA